MQKFIVDFLIIFSVGLLRKGGWCAPNKNELVPVPKTVRILEVIFGDDVVLKCFSNDESHIFDYWMIDKKNLIIGPSNEYYDRGKYKYEILSGNLTVKSITFAEEGIYSCFSKGMKKNDVKVDKINLIVTETWKEVYEHDPNLNLIRILIVLITLLLLSAGGYLLYSMWRDRYRYPSYLEQMGDDDDDSAEELFSAPSTSGTFRLKSPSKIIKDDKKSVDYTDTFETISTDFTSILDTAHNK